MPDEKAVNKRGGSLESLFGSVEEESLANTAETSELTDDESINSLRTNSFSSELGSFSVDSDDGSKTSKNEVEETKLAKCIALLRVVNDFVFDEGEIEEEKKSQALRNDEARYQSLKDSANNVIAKYDERISKYGTNLERYLNFIERIRVIDNEITSEKIKELSETLEPEKKTSRLTRKAMKVRRAVMGFSAGFVLKDKDISKYNKLSKNEKAKIKLIKKLVELEKNQEISSEDKQKRYAEINDSFRAIDSKDKRIEKKETLRILAGQMEKKKLFSRETASRLGDKVAHPYRKIMDRDDLSASDKTLKIGKKIAEKTAQGGKAVTKKIGKVALGTGQFMIKHSVKQPVATVYRGSMAMLNALEYLTLEAKILAEKDSSEKEKLRAEAEIKFQNMGYEGEKFIRAAAATAGIALLDTAMVATAGGGMAAPAALGITASEKFIQGSLAASQAADIIQNTRDGLEQINEGIEEFEKQKRKLTRQETRTKDRRGALSLENLPEKKDNILKRFLKSRSEDTSSAAPYNKPKRDVQSH